MPNITVWWIPDSSPVGTGWPLVARGKRGICYSLPARPNGWSVRKRWEEPGWTPYSKPLPDHIGLIVGGLVGLPGCTMPTPRELAEVGEFLAAARQEFERGDEALYSAKRKPPESFVEVRS